MKRPEKESLSPLEEGLLRAMRSLDKQIAREMQRTPEEEDAHGVQKWGPYQTRVENVTSIIVNALGEQEIGLDSLLVLTQATAKALQMVVSDLGENGLGKIRSAYCRAAVENMARDSREVHELLTQSHELT